MPQTWGWAWPPKPDSQDICFVPDGDYASIVRQLRPDADAPGDIVDEMGNVLGRHAGIVGYTIGQRRRLDIGGLAEPFFVVRIEPNTRRVVVGPRSALAVSAARLVNINCIGDAGQMTTSVKVRSMAPPVPAWFCDDTINFESPEFGVSPGQAAVFYAGDRLVGGGWIDSTERAMPVAAVVDRVRETISLG